MEKFGKFVMNNEEVIGGDGIGIEFIKMMGVVIDCLMERKIRKKYENV
jgi:hypothetical protein